MTEDELEDLLCADEHARALRILSARKQVFWVRSRGLLRALLGRYLERDPRELRFALGPHGKPALAHEGTDANEDLRFNLSHSGKHALIAVTAAHEVGIDLERARERYTGEILRSWVAREAAMKCRGLGIFTPPGVFTPPRDLAPPGDLAQTEPWTAELDVGPDGYAAVAVEGGPCKLHLRDWRAQSAAPPVSVASAMFARKASLGAPGSPGSPGALPPPAPQM